MTTERDKKEDKAMKTTSNARRAHELLDELDARAELSQEQEKLLRSFLPELPAQMSLEALRQDVHDVWAGVNGNGWPDDMYCDLETWLHELHTQLKGLMPAEPVHPEFLETEADYQIAPEGTIIALDDAVTVWLKKFGGWRNTAGDHGVQCIGLADGRRRVLRWGWGK